MTAGRAASVWRNASASNVGGMWFTAKFRLVSSFTTSMSRLMAALVRKRDPILPNAPSFDAAAANSADEAVPPMAAKMIGTSMPRMSHRGVLSNFASNLGAWKTSVARYHKSSVFSRSVTAERPPRLRFCVNPVFWIGVHRFEARDRKLSCARARYRRRTQRGASDRNRAERFRQWVDRFRQWRHYFSRRPDDPSASI